MNAGKFRLASLVLTVASLLLTSSAVRAEAPMPLPGIAFVGGPIVDRENDQYTGAYHWRDGYVYPKGATFNAWERTTSTPRPGRNLYSLVPATAEGKLTQLTFLTTGEVYDPEPSYDGERILFSMRKDGEDWFHLFEMRRDGTGLRQITDGPFNDISGCYLPDGRIVFCSDRSGVLDEYHEERSEFLFRMNSDGTGMEQLTFVPGIYFEPTVLRNGLILCSFWDAFHISVAPFIKHETYLITLRPDGTEERHLFGAGQYKFYNRTRHSAIGLTKPGELPDGRILVQSEMGPSIYDPNLGGALELALAPIFPAMTSVQTGGTTFATHLSPLGTRSTPYPLPDGRFLMAATLPGSRDFGLYAVEPATREMEKLLDRPNVSEWDPIPLGIVRQVPAVLPEKPRDPTSKTATFVIAAGRDSDTPQRQALNQRARFARVIQAEYTDVTTSSHTSLETRILGVVPIQPDGSIAFEAPAETPLFVETLDARGQRLVLQAGYMAARAGEVKSCVGCHSDQSQAARGGSLTALGLTLPKITRETTDLSYRRNDTDEYRRQALILHRPQYRAWLNSDNPEVRRRGLEQLAYVPDEVVAEDRTRFVELLTDPAPEVRRQAAFTLAMTGSADQLPALLTALADADWQVQHFAAMALEAITGENLALQAAHGPKTREAWTGWWRQTGSVEQFVERLSTRATGWKDDFERDAWLEATARTRWLDSAKATQVATHHKPQWKAAVRELLQQSPPPTLAVRAAGLLADPEAVALLTPWLVRGQNPPADESVPDSDEALAREATGTVLAKEAVTALGRIGTPEAVNILWTTFARTVANPSPFATRHYQTGPRPEEYGDLRALIYAGAKPTAEQIAPLVGILPYTEGEKPRFEDRTKIESQRVLLPRLLLERSGFRKPVVELAVQILQGTADARSPLYQSVLAGSNIDRPRSEHGRMFPVLKELSAEQAVHLLASFAVSREEFPEPLVAKLLVSANHRERIDAAVVFRRFGFGPETEAVLRNEIGKPYAFREIWSIGKGRPDVDFRDKSYLMMALAAHAQDLAALQPFTDYTKFYRDIRLGMAIGLGFRGRADAAPLLQRLANDPLFTVHRECENAVIAIRDAELLAGAPITPIALPARNPLKADYPAPGAFAFANQTPDQPVAGAVPVLNVNDPAAIVLALQAAVDAKQYANVGNSFARNASRMRLHDAGTLAAILDTPELLKAPLSPDMEKALTTALDSPFPFAHYLACQVIARRQESKFAPQLIQKLPQYVAAADTVGFYWAADALGRLKAPEALPVFRQLAVDTPQPSTFGPRGMAYGFAAARGLGLMGNAKSQEATALLASPNVWLRAGVLDGLIEGDPAAAVGLLRSTRDEAANAFLEAEASYGLHRLLKGSGG